MPVIFRYSLTMLMVLILSGAARPSAADEPLNNGQDMTRPVARFDLRYQYLNGPQPNGYDNSHIVTFRMDRPIPLSQEWLLATRVDVPTMFTNAISLDNPNGHTRFGLGDALAQAILVRIFSPEFGMAFGAEMVFPTASEDEMGTGQLQVIPTAGARWSTNGWLPGSWVVLAARWNKSVASARDNSTKTNELQFAPIVNIPLPDQWFIDLFPSTDIRYNLGDKREGDTGRWFVPANFMVGKMLNPKTVASVEVGIPIISDYRVYDFKTEARLGFFF